ncbi:hypothetical protein [Bacillus rhizoplanae]|uniref:hypothetical protein n=1 Tax=Bacillus rhizoplanae TaxID=2880966 RepID=UPI003D1D18A4
MVAASNEASEKGKKEMEKMEVKLKNSGIMNINVYHLELCKIYLLVYQIVS